MLQLVASLGADLNQPSKDSNQLAMRPVHWAVEGGAVETLLFLLNFYHKRNLALLSTKSTLLRFWVAGRH